MIADKSTINSLARSCAHLWRKGMGPQKEQAFVLLQGDLGSGKTTFCQSFIRTLYPHIRYIQSPTFTLMQIYQDIVHCDLYRLNNDQTQHLGFEDFPQETLFLIEWPDRLMTRPDHFLQISLEFFQNRKNTRYINISGTDMWYSFIQALIKAKQYTM